MKCRLLPFVISLLVALPTGALARDVSSAVREPIGNSARSTLAGWQSRVMSEIANEPVSTSAGPISGGAENAKLPRLLSIDYDRYLVDPGLPNPIQSAWVFDPALRRIVMWGGAGAYRDGISTLTLDSPRRWTRLPLQNPYEPPVAASAILRSADNTMVVFGGRDTSKTETANSRVDIFTLDASPAYLGDYNPGSGPAARWGHCAVYDPTGDAMFVFGGQSPGNVKYNDVWKLSFSPSLTWTQLSPTGTAPSARVGAAMVLDPSGHRLVIHGGSPAFTPNGPSGPLLSDTWALDLDPTPHWTQLTIGAPGPATCLAAASYDVAGDRMFLFGGEKLSPPADSSTW